MKRRDFLIQGAALAGGAALPRFARAWPIAGVPGGSGDADTAGGVAIICDPADAAVGAPPVRWAVGELRQALADRGVAARVLPGPAEARADEKLVVVSAAGSSLGRASGLKVPPEAESLALGGGPLGEREAVFALGSDVRGLIYAVAELAEIVAIGGGPAALLAFAGATANVPLVESSEGSHVPPGMRRPVIQRPANAVRSVIRLFTSDVEDKPWFNDRAFWREYFALLVAQRFNRVNLSLGLGYDQPEQLKDTYFYFAYPFLVKVPGYDVRATNLPDAERDRNLEQLRFISDEAAAHGLDFQLGLWTHAYHWIDSPDANHVIEGLNPATQAPYCRDALRLLLRECPNITGVTLRIHGESGVPEGSYGLWRTIFEGVSVDRPGRPVVLDLHAKGIDEPTLAAALSVGVPVTISPKFWAEHMGLPYHQAAIRPTEIPTGRLGQGPFTHSEGDRSFTRYGYADLLREDRRYGIVHRIWPGTQRVLLWSDPALAAAYGRAAGICGSLGAEVFDPLSFKGRKGSGLPGGRDGYADLSLRAPGGDFEKYRLTYATWGRALYDPGAPPVAWSRRLSADLGAAGGPAGMALAQASRILPLLTTAHTPSAANNHFWPEMYLNMAIADPTVPVMPYPDTPVPRRFGTVSPLDPQLFSRVEDHADAMLGSRLSGRYSPPQVASWLEELAAGADAKLAEAQRVADSRSAAFRRLEIDTRVQTGLGRFFAWKLRAAVLYALYQRTGNGRLRSAALEAYKRARDHWAAIAQLTSGTYAKDLTYGPAWYQRGHWTDRLAAIDRDIAAMARGEMAGVGPTAAGIERTGGAAGTGSAAAPTVPVTPVSRTRAAALVRAVLQPVRRANPAASHAPPKHFTRGQPLELELALHFPSSKVTSATLHYRHMNQADVWQSALLAAERLRATIPAAYTDSPYPLQYYFEVTEPDRAWLHPGIMPFAPEANPFLGPMSGPALAGQPYFVVRSA